MKQYAKALATIPFVFAVVVAQAQSGLTVNAGLGIFANKDTRDLTSDSGLSLGLSYQLPSVPVVLKGATSVELTYDRTSGGGNKITSFGLGVVQRTALGTSVGGFAPYIGYGVGFASTKLEASIDLGSSTTTIDETKTQLFGKVLIGANVSDKLNVEAFYKFAGKVAGYKTDAYGITVGIKF